MNGSMALAILWAILSHYIQRVQWDTNPNLKPFENDRQDQQRLAEQHEGNGLLELRGNAGSHDLQLGSDTLTALRGANSSSSSPFGIPRYDKSAHSGRGDRAHADTWPQVRTQ